MNILDEHVPSEQRQLLKSWRCAVRQIGYDAGRKGMQDDEIIPLLRRLRQPTFFTLDFDFYKRTLCHERYSIVWLDVYDDEAASFVRRLLGHPELDTQAKRMGTVIRISHKRLRVWRLHAEREITLAWHR
jgi:hypothetical protein